MEEENSQKNRIEELKARTKRCCCKYCGGELEVKRIIYSEYENARIEIFCKNCERVEYGVEKEIYQSAEFFVEEMAFNHYPDLDDNQRRKQMNIAKVCEIMAWENRNMGFLDTDGFTVPVKMNPDVIGNCIVLDDEALEAACQEAGL